VGDVASIREMRYPNIILVSKPDRKRPHERSW